MSPSGWSSLSSIVRAASFVTIPAMWPFFVWPNLSAPVIDEKKPTPGESILYARSMLYLKSLAFTG